MVARLFIPLNPRAVQGLAAANSQERADLVGNYRFKGTLSLARKSTEETYGSYGATRDVVRSYDSRQSFELRVLGEKEPGVYRAELHGHARLQPTREGWCDEGRPDQFNLLGELELKPTPTGFSGEIFFPGTPYKGIFKMDRGGAVGEWDFAVSPVRRNCDDGAISFTQDVPGPESDAQRSVAAGMAAARARLTDGWGKIDTSRGAVLHDGFWCWVGRDGTYTDHKGQKHNTVIADRIYETKVREEHFKGRTRVTQVSAWDPARGFVQVKGSMYQTQLGTYETAGGVQIMAPLRVESGGTTFPVIGFSMQGPFLVGESTGALEWDGSGYRVRE